VQFGPVERGGAGGADRAGPAAQVDDHPGVGDMGERLPHQELGPAARDEDAGCDGDPQTGELGPADHEFEGQTAHAPVHQGGQFAGVGGGGQDEPGLVLGEHTAGGAQGAHDGVVGER
jgi:hypothetical protein